MLLILYCGRGGGGWVSSSLLYHHHHGTTIAASSVRRRPPSSLISHSPPSLPRIPSHSFVFPAPACTPPIARPAGLPASASACVRSLPPPHPPGKLRIPQPPCLLLLLPLASHLSLLLLLLLSAPLSPPPSLSLGAWVAVMRQA